MRDRLNWSAEFLQYAERINWPMTRLTLELAQRRAAVRDAKAAMRLWTEENA